MSEPYRIGLHLAIKVQWALYRSWVRKARKARTFANAEMCLDLAEKGRVRALDLEHELAQAYA